MARSPSEKKASKTTAYLCSRKCHYKARGMGIVGREVERPYDVPPEVRRRSAERRRRLNAQRKAEGRYTVSAETRRKLSLATTKAITEGRISRVSKLEGRVGDVLARLEIPAVPQHPIRHPDGRFGAAIDFYLPEHNAALEVNGTYWHADPRVYPNGPEHPSQKRTVTRYKRKCAFLKTRGIPVIEVWEMDFRDDPERAVRNALAVL